MTRRLRIFLSSPGDVGEERLRAHLVIQKLARDYARFFRIEPYLWEYEPMLASGHFQDAIEPPGAFDVFVLIVHARLGTPLPATSGQREYHGIDGRVPVTGTEWEFEEALAAHRSRGVPDLLAYRKLGDPGVPLSDPVRRAERERQWDALQAFWRRHFKNEGMFIAGSAHFETLEEFDRKFEADLTNLIERRIAEGRLAETVAGEASWLRGSPFRGLAAYDFDDAPVFFGRDADTRTALTRLQVAAEHGCAFLLVLGSSGSGKSSLARAGILPGLFSPKAVEGVGVWRRAVFRPGDCAQDPVLGLARAISSGDPAHGIGLPEILARGMQPEALAAHLAAASEDPSFPFRVALEHVAEAGRASGLLPHETARLVLLIDQLEEIFTQTTDATRRAAFLRLLAGLARSGVVWVVATMRSDLWHHVADAPALLDLIEAGARLDLRQPDGSEIIEIIRRPARAAGLVFETAADTGVALDAVMARAAAEEPGALPLLSVMLDTLYQRDVKAPSEAGATANTLTFATYKGLGELRGAIARRAEEALEALRARDPEAAAALPAVLRALVTSSGGEKVASRPARLSGFAADGPEMRLIRHFLAPENRLLVTSGDAEGAEVRVAHEALIENWPAARDQIARDRRDIETRARLEALQRRWAEAAGAERRRALLSGLNLAEGADLAARWRIDQASALGAFIAASARADRLRRHRLAIAASVLVLLFAGIAGAAALQWRRADQHAQAEREARTVADSERAEAVHQSARADAERDRAKESEQRAVAALTETKRQTARVLATEAELAAGQHDTRRALQLAVQAGETERDVLAPGGAAASTPALLQTTEDLRQVLQVRRSGEGLAMPYAFVGDGYLAYAEWSAGLVVAELGGTPRIVSQTKFPTGFVPVRIRPLPGGELIAVTGNKRLLLIDPGKAAIVRDIALPGLVTSIDATDDGKLIAVAAGAAIGLVQPDGSEPPVIVPVPQPQPRLNVAQVRLDKSGQTLFVNYGTDVLSFDVSQRHFADAPVGALDGSAIDFTPEMIQKFALASGGLLPPVEMIPNLMSDHEVLFRTPLDLRSLDTATGAARTYALPSHDDHVLAIAFVGPEHTGAMRQAVVVLGQRSNVDQEFRFAFITSAGALMPPFDDFKIRAADVAGETIDSCQISRNQSYMACEYYPGSIQGIAVWLIRGGNHRFEQVAGVPGTSAILAANGDPIVATSDAIVERHQGEQTKLAAITAGWRLSGRAGPYVVTVTEPAGKAQVWQLQDGDASLQPVLGPVDAKELVVDATGARAFVRTDDQVAAYDLHSGQTLWTVPGLHGLRAIALAGQARQLVAVAKISAYVFDASDGHIVASAPADPLASGPVAIDPQAGLVSLVDEHGGVRLLDPATRRSDIVGGLCIPAAFAWSPDGQTLLVGCRTGAVLGLDRAGHALWSIASPLGDAFKDTPSGQPPPKGAVLELAFSPDGKRLGVAREDMPTVDLYDVADGQFLTRIAPPWSFTGVPAHVALADGGRVLATWAFNRLTLATPGQITLHRLPEDFPTALAEAKSRLAALQVVWNPNGPPATVPGQVEQHSENRP